MNYDKTHKRHTHYQICVHQISFWLLSLPSVLLVWLYLTHFQVQFYHSKNNLEPYSKIINNHGYLKLFQKDSFGNHNSIVVNIIHLSNTNTSQLVAFQTPAEATSITCAPSTLMQNGIFFSDTLVFDLLFTTRLLSNCSRLWGFKTVIFRRETKW